MMASRIGPYRVQSGMQRTINASTPEGDFIQFPSVDVWHQHTFFGITDRYEKEGLLIFRPPENILKEIHWTRSMGQRHQARIVDGCQKKSNSDPHGFLNVIILMNSFIFKFI